MDRRRIDPLARQTVLAIAAGRIAIGVGAVFATRPALKALGFAEVDAAGTALGRIAGGRDLALGLLALAARDDQRALRIVGLAGAAVDASDAITFGVAARWSREAQPRLPAPGPGTASAAERSRH